MELERTGQAGVDGTALTDGHGQTPLIYAVLGDAPDTLTLLLRAGADPDLPDAQQQGPLHWAACHGRANAFRTLLAAGAKADARTAAGASALHWACVCEGTACLEQLLQHGAARAGGGVSPQDSELMTPLAWAAFYGRAKHLPLLLAAGAQISARDRLQRSPLHMISISPAPSLECAKVREQG